MKKIINMAFFVLLLVVVVGLKYRNKDFDIHTNVTIAQGQGLGKFLDELDWGDKLKVKIRTKSKNTDLTKIEVGSYFFSGAYDPESFVKHVLAGPSVTYTSLKILEGRGIRDTDAYLVSKGLISKGDYSSYVQKSQNIRIFADRYGFIGPDIASLEGFLYPDTYFVDSTKDVIPQLVVLQLKNFNSKIRSKYGNDFANFNDKLKASKYSNLKFSTKGILTLASIIQQEERSKANRPVIAGLFLNRLSDGMRLDADVSLCYGLQVPYSDCRSMIVPNLDDASNIYNTRQNIGLTPSPISSPDENSIMSLLFFAPSNYYFYLHDNDGIIHFAKDISDHNFNKNKYLK